MMQNININRFHCFLLTYTTCLIGSATCIFTNIGYCRQSADEIEIDIVIIQLIK